MGSATVLVVGAAGRFGGLVVPELMARGAMVRALVRSGEQEPVARRGHRHRAEPGQPQCLVR